MKHRGRDRVRPLPVVLDVGGGRRVRVLVRGLDQRRAAVPGSAEGEVHLRSGRGCRRSGGGEGVPHAHVEDQEPEQPLVGAQAALPPGLHEELGVARVVGGQVHHELLARARREGQLRGDPVRADRDDAGLGHLDRL
ncbi:MAG: hypothetical protein ACK559_35285, partial [bacterium]